MRFHFVRRVFASLFVVAMGSSSVSAQHAQQVGLSNSDAQVGRQQRARLPVALEGYCAVCLVRGHRWVQGTAEHSVVYDGWKYFFPGENEKEVFLSAPAQYAPVLNGDSVVAYAESGQRVPGNIQQAMLHEGRLYLFQNEAEKQRFARNPAHYARADLAYGGKCAVCLSHGGNVDGMPEFAARYQGLRYWFPSAKQQAGFLAQPAKFAHQKVTGLTTATAGGATCPCGSKNCKACQSRRGVPAGMIPTGNVAVQATQSISVRGTTTCATCEYGVPPLGDKETLGLAVEASNGQVYIVEDAHRLYPKLYGARFQGLPVELKGQVLQTDGKFVWVSPTTLKTAR